MVNKAMTRQQGIMLFLCVVVLFGFFQPAVRLNFSIMNIERGANLSIATFFESGDGFINFDLSDTDFASLFEDSDVMADVGVRVIFSVVAYFMALLGTLAMLFFIFFGRFRLGVRVILIVSLVLIISAGWVASTIAPLVNQILNNTIQRSVVLRFIALFIDTSQIIGLQLQRGYWWIVLALGAILFVDVFYMAKEKGKLR